MTTAEITNPTRTCQETTFSSSRLLMALEAAWNAIRARHPEVPDAVLVVGSGSPAKPNAAMKWGHFAALRWQHGDTKLPEVLVSGEGLKRTPHEVLVTLLHEATHGLADVRGVQDTSRQGRWHNRKFATLAAELGLKAAKDDKLGYSPCTLTDQAAADYTAVIKRLANALNVYRHPEVFGEGKKRTNNNNGVACECECPRKLRLAIAAFDEGPIVCAVCASAFLPEHIDRDTYEHPTFGTSGDTYRTGDCATCGTSGVPVTSHPGTNVTFCVDARACQTRLHPTDTDSETEDPMVFYDPTGDRYGIPTYPFKMAPAGLATIRQLRAEGLRPGGQSVAAQLLWRKGNRVAYLYDINLAVPKRTATPAQLAALDKAMLARRTCPDCGQVKGYYIPRRTGACLDCTPRGAR